MARQKSAQRVKGQNGVGDTLQILFDVSDPTERRALEAARLLAKRHGRRKQAILAMLEAIYTRYEATGEVMTPMQIAAALNGQTTAAQRPSIGFTPVIGRQIPQPPTPNFSPSSAQSESLITVEEAPSKITAQEFANNFLSSIGGFLD